ERDPVGDAATPGHVRAFRRCKQMPDIDPTDDVPGARVDACNEVRLIDVRPQLSTHPLQLVEHPDGAVSFSHLNRALLVESRRIDDANSTGAIAHVKSAAGGGESPSLTSVGEAVDRGECGAAVHVPATALPCQLINAVAHARNSFSELCRRRRGSPTYPSRAQFDLAHVSHC